MAEKSFPWTNNATGDGTSGGYTALEWSEIWRKAFLGGGEASQGVCKGVDNELAVTGTASPVAVNTGAAFVYGKFYQNTASVNLTVATPVVGTTGGHVILRLDWTAQTVRLVAVRNTDGVNSTPSLTQSTSTQWEIRLATFTITTGGVITLTDARAYVHMSQRVATANIDDDAVDDTKAGNRVSRLVKRQSSDATDWTATSVSTTNYTPTMVIEQVGAIGVNVASGSGSKAVTFPQAFSAPPIVTVQVKYNSSNEYLLNATVGSVTSTGFTIQLKDPVNTFTQTTVVFWRAIGAE